MRATFPGLEVAVWEKRRQSHLYKTQPLLIPRKLPWGCTCQGIHPGSHGADLKGWHQDEHVCREEDGNKAFCGWESRVWGRRTSPESNDDSQDLWLS